MSSMSRPRVACIGTGGTIGSVGRGPLDTQDYSANGKILHIDALLDLFPIVHEVAEIVPVPYRNVISTEMGFADWKALTALAHKLVAEDPELDGIVITHGTSALEETAYALSLSLKIPVPVVLVGAQRPNSALSTDAGMNLVNAIRVAGSRDARGMGVLVLLNDEIHAARDVTKTSTFRLQTFRTPDFGALGHADADAVVFYRRPLRHAAPDTEFDILSVETPPRVDISYSYAGADGAAVRAFVAAGAQGLVCAGFAPGFVTQAENEALTSIIASGIPVVMSTRSGSGRVFRTTRMAAGGYLSADNLTPQKARILLQFALTKTRDPAEITRIFATY